MDIKSISNSSESIITQHIHQEDIAKLVSDTGNSNLEIKKRGQPKGLL